MSITIVFNHLKYFIWPRAWNAMLLPRGECGFTCFYIDHIF